MKKYEITVKKNDGNVMIIETIGSTATMAIAERLDNNLVEYKISRHATIAYGSKDIDKAMDNIKDWLSW